MNSSLSSLSIGTGISTEKSAFEDPIEDCAVALAELGLAVAHGGCEAPEDLLIGQGRAGRVHDLGLGRKCEMEVGRLVLFVIMVRLIPQQIALVRILKL